MDLGLKGKAAIITGSGRGIGRAIALGLAAEGCNVVIISRHEEELREVAAGVKARGAEAAVVVADVTTAEGVDLVVREAVAAFGRIDILVNNVGGNRGSQLMDTTEEQFREVLDMNLFPAIRFAQAVVPYMRQQRAGAIVNISSIWGRESGGNIAYNVAKAGEISLSKAMARDLAPFHIRVNNVAPGSILFPGGSWERRVKADPAAMAEFERREIPLGFGRPEDVANVVVFLVSDRASHVSGASWTVDGAQSRSNI